MFLLFFFKKGESREQYESLEGISSDFQFSQAVQLYELHQVCRLIAKELCCNFQVLVGHSTMTDKSLVYSVFFMDGSCSRDLVLHLNVIRSNSFHAPTSDLYTLPPNPDLSQFHFKAN